jgi:hypothetical protein
VELYQACKVIIALLSRWTDELNSKYVDDVHAYMEYLGDSSLMGMGTAYLWKASELGMIDSKYMNNCREYFWDAELNYGETAYILVKAIEGVLPAGCDGEECPHGGKADKNGNGVIDCYIEDIMRAGESDETLSGIVLGPDPSLDVLGSEEVNLGIFVGGNTHVEIKFTAEEFMKMAVLTDGKVDLTAGENGYEVNTLVSVKYHGDASITEKTADRIRNFCLRCTVMSLFYSLSSERRGRNSATLSPVSFAISAGSSSASAIP